MKLSLSSMVGAFAALLSSAVLLAQSAVPATRGKALLVGINDYPKATGEGDTRELPTALRGAVNDVHRVRRVLMQRFGFESKDIVMLLDDEATHANILKELHALSQGCDENTNALFWYSGHGSLIPDKTKKESVKVLEDGSSGFFDGSFVCHDARNQKDVNRDISDDEVYSLVRLIAKKAKQTVVVTDSCYSGGATRGGSYNGSRFHPQSKLKWDAAFAKSVLPEGVELLDDDSKQREIDRREGLRYVHIAACSDTEEAKERNLSQNLGGEVVGTLTFALTSAWNADQSPGSWRQLGHRVRAAVSAHSSQTVWFEGDLDSPVFGGVYREMAPGYPAQGRKPSNLLVEAGRVHGIGVGAELEVCDLDGKRVGSAKVERVLPETCECVFLGNAPSNVESLGFLVRPTDAAGQRAPLRLLLGEGVDPALLQGSKWATAVPSGEDALVELRDGKPWILEADGVAVRALGGDSSELELALYREYCYRMLKDMAAAPGRRKVELRVDSGSPVAAEKNKLPLARIERRSGKPIVVHAPAFEKGEGGGLVTITVQNTGKEPCHITVLSVCDDRSVNVIYPNDDQPDNRLGAGAEKTVDVIVGANPAWTSKRPMVDRYIAIATPKSANFASFRGDAQVYAPQATRGEGGSDLPGPLDFALEGQQTRGGSAANRSSSSAAASDFGVALLELHLPRPQLQEFKK